MKKTGTILKEAREKKGISIYEVSTATKINTKNIMAMEEGAVDRLPPKTFLRGFVASYATFLQIDTTEILKIFFEEMGSTRPEVAVRDLATGELQKPSDPRENSRTDKSAVAALTDNKKIGYFKIYGIIGIVILIVIIGLIKRKMDSYESESVPQIPAATELKASERAPSPVNTPVVEKPVEVNASMATSPTASPTATSVSTPTPSPTATPKATAADTPAPTATPKPTASPTPTPTPKPSPSPNATPDAATSAAKAKASPSPTPAAGKAQEVVIEALNDVEVMIQVDNEPSKKMTLHHDEVQSIKARRKVSMKFSDGGAVNLTVNGRDKGVPGDLGKPKKVDVP